ncbi:MAG: peptidylprolyl isomerase [Acidimicrobiales bacterium]
MLPGPDPLEPGPLGLAPVGWVDGVPVTGAEVEDYLGRLSGTTVAARLGLEADAGPGGRGAPGTGPPPIPRGDAARAKAIRSWGAKALLADRLLAQEAARFGVQDPGSLEEWMAGLERAGALRPGRPGRAEVLANYCANEHLFREPEARRVRHVVVGDRGLAEHLAATAPGPGALAALAQAHSLDEGSRARGGDLGWVERGQLSGPFEEAAFSAPPGQLYGPVASPFGWHLLVVEQVRAERVRPFAECEHEILATLVHDLRRGAWRQWWQRRLAEAISMAPGFEHPLVPGLPGSPHRH